VQNQIRYNNILKGRFAARFPLAEVTKCVGRQGRDVHNLLLNRYMLGVNATYEEDL
jgi:hypothetical protein